MVASEAFHDLCPAPHVTPYDTVNSHINEVYIGSVVISVSKSLFTVTTLFKCVTQIASNDGVL
jgi:hypothetical protein